MFCGTRSFSDLDDGSRRASSPRPKLSKLKQSLSLDRGKKQTSNPYSKEGLDKFEKLVAELEAKKEEVLLKKNKKKKGGSSDQDSTTIVRFKYNSDTGDWIPIVVRLQPAEAKKKKKKADQSSKEKPIRAPPPPSTEEIIKEVDIKQEVAVEEKSSMYRWMNVQHFWAMRMMIVVLVVSCCCCFFLLIIGRAFVVCSATILWYVVPIIMNSEGISWDWEVYGKRALMMITSTTDNWLPRNFNLGVAPSSSPSSMNVKKKGSVLLVSNPRRSTVK